jgi:hypothetical protein
MAVLTAAQLGKLLREMDIKYSPANALPTDYTKAQFNAACQAIEDWFEGQRTAISTAINVATSPLVLTAAQKRFLVKAYLFQKFERE